MCCAERINAVDMDITKCIKTTGKHGGRVCINLDAGEKEERKLNKGSFLSAAELKSHPGLKNMQSWF